MEEERQQSLWNFDGAELYLIFEIKSAVVYALKKWDIKDAYGNVRLMRMELDAKLIRHHKKIIEEFEDGIENEKLINKSKNKKEREKKLTEKEEVDELIKELDEAYTKYLELNNPNDKEMSSIYQAIEFVYMFLCSLMKKHGLYFREGEDMRLAVLKR